MHEQTEIIMGKESRRHFCLELFFANVVTLLPGVVPSSTVGFLLVQFRGSNSEPGGSHDVLGDSCPLCHIGTHTIHQIMEECPSLDSLRHTHIICTDDLWDRPVPSQWMVLDRYTWTNTAFCSRSMKLGTIVPMTI